MGKMGTKKYVAADWEERFLELFRTSCSVSLAAHGVGIHRNTVYERKRKSKHFAHLLDDAKRDAIDRLEGAAFARALKQSDTLAIFLLKAHKPDTYYDRLKLEGGFDPALVNAVIRALVEAGVDPSATFNAIIAQVAHVDAESNRGDGA